MAGAPQAESFDALACDLARHQAAHIPALRQLWRAHGIEAASLRRAETIPALVCDAFRHRRIAVHAASEDAYCFETSGTSQGQQLRGKHPLRSGETYTLGAVLWGRQMLLPAATDLGLVGLVASEVQAPHSSLSFMLARFAQVLTAESSFHFNGNVLDVDGIIERCTTATQQGRPLLLAGTSFAFVHLLDALANRGLRLPLSPGSRLMQTGGFKGRSRVVEAATLSAQLAHCFQLPRALVVGEYGMTELSSQLYQPGVRDHFGHAKTGDDGAGAAATSSAAERYYPPPWLRVTAVDPVTLAPLAVGAVGLCRLLDLANVDSAVAIQTADRCRVYPDGSIDLLGRQPGARARGCSLALEHIVRDVP